MTNNKQFDSALGKALKKRRLDIGMNQKTFGTALGITFQQVQKYESGTNTLSAYKLTKAAEILGVGVMGLLAMDDVAAPEGSAREIIVLVGAYRECPVAARKIIRDLAHVLKNGATKSI